MPRITVADIRRALAQASGCSYLLTSRSDGKSGGILAMSAQACGHDPPLICIAVPKGHGVDLLIRDSHCFALCCIPAADRLILRRFADPQVLEVIFDPFDGLPTLTLISGAPVLERSVAAFDCQLFRQFDLETDHELIIGMVLAVRMNESAS